MAYFDTRLMAFRSTKQKGSRHDNVLVSPIYCPQEVGFSGEFYNFGTIGGSEKVKIRKRYRQYNYRALRSSLCTIHPANDLNSNDLTAL